ncbi:MAG: FAD-dependent oxidoreductase [Nitrososphaeria archaeon]
MSNTFTTIFKAEYNVFLGFEPKKVTKSDDNFEVLIENKGSGQTETLKSDQLLVTSGRIPNSDILKVQKTGVRMSHDGNILVDEYLETNVNGIFALGDIVWRYPFKHNANLEATYALNNILNPDDKIPVDYTAMPHGIFSSPQTASVGKAEQQLRADNSHYLVGRYNYIDTAMGSAIEDRQGLIKILVDKHTRRNSWMSYIRN